MNKFDNKKLYKLAPKILLGFLGTSVVLIKPCLAQSNIVKDDTLGSEASKITPNVDVDGIPSELIEGGAERGQNLFHSLQKFNVGEGRGAYFVVPNDNIQNVLTRVTGNGLSEILGTLGIRQQVGGDFVGSEANLFLINPNGIVFGENARLDVGGSFVGTTANGVQFGERGVFSATNPQAPSKLLTVNPSAFLFSQINAQATIKNSSIAPAETDLTGSERFGLRVPDGKSLLLVGGDIRIDGGQLNALGGRIELGGLSEPGNITLDVDGDDLSLGFPENVSRTDVSLTNEAGVFVTGSRGGNITVNSRNLEIFGNSVISAGILSGQGTPDTVAGDIILNATGKITVEGFRSQISNRVGSPLPDTSSESTLIPQNSPQPQSIQSIPIKLGVPQEENNTRQQIDSDESETEKPLDPTTPQPEDNKSQIVENSVDSANRQVGRRGTENENIAPSETSSYVETVTVGNGGNIVINTGSFSLRENAQLSTSTFGQGNAGNVTVNAKNTVSLEVGDIFSTVEAEAVGKGGNIDINAATLTLQDGAQLQTITREASETQPAGKGDAGNVNVTVTGIIDIAGNTVVDNADEKEIFPSGILSRVGTKTQGNGGNITLKADSFNLRDGAQLSTSTFGQGNAGNVNVTVKDAVSLVNLQTVIFSTVEAGGVGKGGNIDINAATLTIQDGAQLQTVTSKASDNQPAGKGDAGNVNVKVTGVIDIAGVKNQFETAIFSSVEIGTEGKGGDIKIDAGSFKLRDGALLDARTENGNRGGDITVNTDLFEALNGGQLITTSSSSGSAGKITANATKEIVINDSDPTYSTRVAEFGDDVLNIDANSGFFVNSTGTGNTGDIEINSPEITLDNQGKLNAESASGNGGNINLNVNDLLLLRRGSQITTNAGTEAKGGDGGSITINSNNGFIVTAPKENNDITANAFTGKGGNVGINFPEGIFGFNYRQKPTDITSDITASSELGIPGSINVITEENSNIENSLTELPQNQIDSEALITTSCVVRSKERNGTFFITGKTNLPYAPQNAVPSNYSAIKVQPLPDDTSAKKPRRRWKMGDPIVEPSGVYRLENGRRVLSRECGN